MPAHPIRVTEITAEVPMEYTVSCECRKAHRVSAGAAGSRFACECGREVTVPSLHVLRLQAGEDALGPEIRLETALRTGELPTWKACVRCLMNTNEIAFVWAICERQYTKRPSVILQILFALAFGALGFLIFYRGSETRVYGRDRTFRLPIRLCEQCRRGLKGRALREAVLEEALYADLIQKFPGVELTLAPQ